MTSLLPICAKNKACKYIINSSDDRNILVKFAKETETEIVEAEVEEEIRNNANKEVIDIDSAIDAECTPAEPAAEAEPPKEEKKAASKAKEKEANKELQQIALDEEGPGY